jgi:hypothetical protein
MRVGRCILLKLISDYYGSSEIKQGFFLGTHIVVKCITLLKIVIHTNSF